jgi:predicted GNAT family N-acyltransferase
MLLIDQFRRLFARNGVERQLYPAPTISFRFRLYQPADREAVLKLHDLNAAGRFPTSGRIQFEQYLDGNPASHFIVETRHGDIAACCGVVDIGNFVHNLCFGLIAPAFQGCRIGSTMTLARICFASREPGTHFATIHAVPKSIGFYRRFGFQPFGDWLKEDGIAYPSGILSYSSSILGRIESALKERGHFISPTMPVEKDLKHEAVIVDMGLGIHRIDIKLLESGTPPGP